MNLLLSSLNSDVFDSTFDCILPPFSCVSVLEIVFNLILVCVLRQFLPVFFCLFSCLTAINSNLILFIESIKELIIIFICNIGSLLRVRIFALILANTSSLLPFKGLRSQPLLNFLKGFWFLAHNRVDRPIVHVSLDHGTKVIKKENATSSSETWSTSACTPWVWR